MTEPNDGAFERLFDELPKPSYIVDRETLRIARVNRAAVELYGWSVEEFCTLTLRDIRPPDDMNRFENALVEHNDRKGSFTLMALHRTKSGRNIEVEVDITRTTFRGRAVSLVIATDVTGVRELERRLRLLAEHSREGVAVTGVDRRVIYMSPGGERMLGLAPAELVGQRADDRIHPDDLAGLGPIAPGETRTGIHRWRRNDGTWCWIEATNTNLTEDPEVRGWVSNFRDITRRVETERSLRRSEANFRVLAERSPTIMLVHRAGKIVYMNPAAITALGYERLEDVVGMAIVDLVHPDDRDSVVARMAHTARHGGGAPGEARMRRRDGTYMIADGEGIVLDFDGQPSHVVVGLDATARRELFARMALADRLVSVGTLAAGVAHEINNPLAYVSSNLELLGRELPILLAGQPSQLSHVEIEALLADAREGAARVGAIVRDLRALSRTDDEPGAVDVAAVLASCIKIADNESRHRARIVAQIAKALPRVSGTPSRLGQVFLNLILNAAQAIPEGSAGGNEIRVRAYAGAAHVIVEVSDTGAGIPPDVVGRIFDPFFTTKPVGQGTGLGLSISHEILRALGGTISVASTLGVGTTFTVTLPLAAGTSVATARDDASEGPPAARVLVIDDEQAVGRSIALLLSPEYDVTCVTRAKEALAKLTAGERYDAIVCDLMMPEMTGIDFYRHLAPELQRRILFLTGGAFTPVARELLVAAERPYLDKPFSERDLRLAIEAVRGSA